MGKYEFNCVGLPVVGMEVDMLSFGSNDCIGISGLLEEAGAESVDGFLATCALRYERCEPRPKEDYSAKEIVRYRTESGRQYPQLYRIKISVETEPLTDAENEAAWLARREQESREQESGEQEDESTP